MFQLDFLIPLFYEINIYASIIAWIIIMFRGLARHDNRCSWLIGNHHILHHKYPKYNFGEYWLDLTFGTLCPEVNQYKRGIIYM
jgi:sterol desaturase/sphingolipid hydroxylase (fatty acid hydroxylase superfamily)